MSLDARADVYALGVILYECFAAQRPFDADSLTHLAVLIHTGQAKPLLEHRPDLPPGVPELVSRAMATDRSLRIQSAQDLKNELSKFGAIAFRSTQAAMPPAPAVLPTPPMSAMGSPGLATSAAGVSVAQARSQVTTMAQQKSQRNAIIAGFAALAVVGVVGAVLVRGGGQPASDASVSAAPVTKPVDPPRAASPAPPEPAPQPAASSAAPLPSAAAAPSVAPPRTAAPQPASPTPAAKAPVAAPAQPAAQPAAAKPPADGTKRTEQKGLVKENPFK
jgi:serine/threonine-protein kinase